MNNARMLKLADHLDALPRKRFHMGWFFGFENPYAERDYVDECDPSAIAKALKKKCGTSACIAGWAVALHPRAGLDAAYPSHWGNSPVYNIMSHAQAILGLSEDEAQHLFLEDMDQSPKQAARKIRRAVKKGVVD